MTPIIYRYKSDEDFVADAAAAMEDCILMAVQEKGFARVALSGGSSPKAVYRALSTQPLPWGKVEFFLVDERHVPFDSEHSNYRMIRESLLDHTSRSVLRFFDTTLDPPEAAKDYENALRELSEPLFDLVVLGMGADGHTASLFPDTPELEEERCLVAPTVAENQTIRNRLSLTFPALMSSERVIFMVRGKEKAKVVEQWLEKKASVNELPAVRMLEHPHVEAYIYT